MTNELTERLQVRLTTQDLAEVRSHTRAMGLKPGTMLRHLVLAWLAQRRQGAVAPREVVACRRGA